MEKYKIIIIGAGPSGVSIAYYLEQMKCNYIILEEGSCGNRWKGQYDCLRLNMLKQLSYLPNSKMPNSLASYPLGKDYYNYLIDYVEKNKIKIKEGAKVTSAEYTNGIWQVICNQKVIYSEVLILCTGISKPNIPKLSGIENFNGVVIHSSEYKNSHKFMNQKVLVVGCGSSGIDIANDLAMNGVDVSICIKKGINIIYRTNLLGLTQRVKINLFVKQNLFYFAQSND